MKQKHEGKDLQGLVDLGREQGYLTFDQVNDFLPQDVASPGDLRAALESFEDMDIKVLDEVPSEGTEVEAEAETKEEPEEEAVDNLSESSDPVRLYLKEMGNFQLLSREQEVEIAKRIEAGEKEVEDEVLHSPVALDRIIQLAEEVETGEGDLRDIFEENEEQSDADEERGAEANEKQLKKLLTAKKNLLKLRSRIEQLEERLKNLRAKSPVRTKLERGIAHERDKIKRELQKLELSHHVESAIINEMRNYLQRSRKADAIIEYYEQATGRTRTQLRREAGGAEDRRHL